MGAIAGMPTILDLAKQRGTDQVVGLIEESILVSPEIRTFPARTISGTSYKTLVRVGYPTAAFRSGNEGSPRSKSQFENRMVECYIIDTQIGADKAIADAWEPGGAAAYQMIEALGVVEATHRRVGKSTYYGNGAVSVAAGLGDKKGFPGFVDCYDNTAHEIDVAGTTAKTSCWAVKLGIKDVHFIVGRNTVLDLLPDWRIQTIDDDAGNPFTAYVNALMGWIGLQVGSTHSLVRAKNIGTDAGTGTYGTYGMTDKVGQAMLELFPTGIFPDFFIMNRRSRRQLTQSRQPLATGALPTNVIVPLATEIEGVPILITDQLSNAETF